MRTLVLFSIEPLVLQVKGGWAREVQSRDNTGLSKERSGHHRARWCWVVINCGVSSCLKTGLSGSNKAHLSPPLSYNLRPMRRQRLRYIKTIVRKKIKRRSWDRSQIIENMPGMNQAPQQSRKTSNTYLWVPSHHACDLGWSLLGVTPESLNFRRRDFWECGSLEGSGAIWWTWDLEQIWVENEKMRWRTWGFSEKSALNHHLEKNWILSQIQIFLTSYLGSWAASLMLLWIFWGYGTRDNIQHGVTNSMTV